jgi:hypothetical protein
VTCRCPGERPITIATFRNSTLTSVIRHHLRPCPAPDETLDRVEWTPREPGPVLAYTQPPRPWWEVREERRQQETPPDALAAPQPRARRVRADMRTEARWGGRR